MQVDIAEERMKKIKEAFDLFDTDNKGNISVTDVGNIFKYMGQEISDQEVENHCGDLTDDQEDDTKIDFVKFMKLTTKVLKDDDTYDELISALRVFDTEGTGMIATAEMRYILIEMGEKMNPVEVKDILKEMDPEDTGMCKYTDYMKKKYEDLKIAKAKKSKKKKK